MRLPSHFRHHRWVSLLLLGGLLGPLSNLLLSPVAAIAQTDAPLLPPVAPSPSATIPPATSPSVLPPLSPAMLPPLSAPGNVVTPPAPLPAVAPKAEAPKAEVPQADVLRLLLKRGERRVYVYKNDKVVAKYPVAVGKKGWETPIGKFNVLNMEENPTFKSFKSGRIIPPGPDNPLGVRWIGIWTDGTTQLGFHGTNEPELIGQAVSHGCIRMLNKDVVKLYSFVQEGTVVEIVP